MHEDEKAHPPKKKVWFAWSFANVLVMFLMIFYAFFLTGFRLAALLGR